MDRFALPDLNLRICTVPIIIVIIAIRDKRQVRSRIPKKLIVSISLSMFQQLLIKCEEYLRIVKNLVLKCGIRYWILMELLLKVIRN